MDSSNYNSFGGAGSISSGAAGGFSSGAAGGFSSGAVGGPVFSSDSSDSPVFIGGSVQEAKKPHKWLIGLAIGLVLAVVALIIAVVVVGRGNGGSVEKTKEHFYKFANYVLSGEENNSAAITSEYDISEGYYFVVSQKTQEQQQDLFDKTGKLLKAFKEKYNKLSADAFGDKSQEISQNVNDESDMFDFMKVVYTKKVLRASDIRTMYLEKGYDGALNEAVEYYGGLKDTANGYIAGFKEVFESWVKYQLGVLVGYDQAGCVSDKMVNLQCVYEQQVENPDSETIASTGDVLQGELSGYYNLNLDFVSNIFMIDALMNNKSYDYLLAGGVDE